MKDASWLQHLTTHWTKMCVKCVSKALNMSPLSQQVVSANFNPPIQGSLEQKLGIYSEMGRIKHWLCRGTWLARSQCCLKPQQGTFDQTKEDSSSEKKMVMASGGWTVSPLGQLGDVRTSPRAAKTRPMHHLWVHHLPHNNQNWGWLYSKSPHNFPCDPMIIPYSKKNSPRFRSMVILHKNPSAIFGRCPS